MQTRADKNQENQCISTAPKPGKEQEVSTFQVGNNRPEAIQMQKLQQMANDYSKMKSFQVVYNRPGVEQTKRLQESANNSPQIRQLAQLKKLADKHSTMPEFLVQRITNRAQLPENLKTEEKKLSNIQDLSETIQRVKVVENPEAKKDAKTFFRLRKGEGDATSGAHNYAFLNSVPSHWAKSSGAGHAETQLIALYADDREPIFIVSELKPCNPCMDFLEKVENARDMDVTVYFSLPHNDKGDGNKEAIVKMYQGYNWLTDDPEYTTQITETGLNV